MDQILQDNPETKGIRLHTYQIIPIANQCFLVEWLPNTTTIKTLLHSLNNVREDRLSFNKVIDNFYKGKRNLDV